MHEVSKDGLFSPKCREEDFFRQVRARKETRLYRSERSTGRPKDKLEADEFESIGSSRGRKGRWFILLSFIFAMSERLLWKTRTEEGAKSAKRCIRNANESVRRLRYRYVPETDRCRKGIPKDSIHRFPSRDAIIIIALHANSTEPANLDALRMRLMTFPGKLNEALESIPTYNIDDPMLTRIQNYFLHLIPPYGLWNAGSRSIWRRHDGL